MSGSEESRTNQSQYPAVTLSDLESISFLVKEIWSPGHTAGSKCLLNLLDIVLFHDGTPFRWLFTSNKSGEVMKKKEEKLSHSAIIKSFKSRSSALNAKKTPHSAGPIATVWYFESNAAVKSKLANEKELTQLLGSKQSLNNVLGIQVYFGGLSLKGSGVFEHWMQVNQGGRRQHQTLEFSNVKDAGLITIFSAGIPKLPVTEAQQNSIRDISRKLVKALERSSKCTVANIVVQIAFDATWAPYIISAKNIVLWNAPNDWHANSPHRDSVIFASGFRPSICKTISNRAHEMTPLDEEKNKNQIAFERNESQRLSPHSRTFNLPSSLLPHDVKASLLNSSRSSADVEGCSTQTDVVTEVPSPRASSGQPVDYIPDAVDSAGTMNESPASSHPDINHIVSDATVNLAARAACTKKLFRNRKQSVGENMIDFFKMLEASDDKDQDSSTEQSNVEVEKDGNRNENENEINEIQNTSSGSITSVKSFVDDSHCKEACSALLDNDADSISMIREDVVKPECTEECSQDRPHSSSQSNRKSKSPVELGDVSVVKAGNTANPVRKRSLGMGPNPIQGPCCLGDYCHLLQRSSSPKQEGDGGKGLPVGSDKCRPKSGSRPSSSSSIGLKPTVSECPFQLAYKSILLDRAEIALLGPVSVAIREGMQGSLETPDDDIDTILLNYARGHIQRVASWIRDKVTRSVLDGSLGNSPDTLHGFYHNTVYNVALESAQPNRFYRIVPICKVCHKMYSMLDHERGETISATPSHTIENQSKRGVDKNSSQSRSNCLTDAQGMRAVDSTCGNKDGETKDRTNRTNTTSGRSSQNRNMFHFGSIVKNTSTSDASTRRKPMYEGAEYFQFDTGDHPAYRSVPIHSHNTSGGEGILTDGDTHLCTPHTTLQCRQASALVEGHEVTEGGEGGQILDTDVIYDPVQRWYAAQKSCTSLKAQIRIREMDRDREDLLSSQGQGGLKSKSSDALPTGAFPVFSGMHITGRPRSSAMQLHGADRLSRGKSAVHLATNAEKDVPHVLVRCVSFGDDMSGDKEAPVDKKLRAITNEKKQARKREAGWNASHNVLHEEERHLENLKRMDYNRLQRLEQLKLLHLSYDEVKEQRVAREERMRKRKQVLLQRERKKYLEQREKSRQACEVLREDEGKSTDEPSAEEAIGVANDESDDSDAAMYLEEQEQLGNEEEEGEEEEEEEEEEGEWKVNDPLPSGQLLQHQRACQLMESEAQRQCFAVHSSEEDNLQIAVIHANENGANQLGQEDGEGEGEEGEEKGEGYQGNGRGLISRGGRGGEEVAKGVGGEGFLSRANSYLKLAEIVEKEEEKQEDEENKEEEKDVEKGDNEEEKKEKDVEKGEKEYREEDKENNEEEEEEGEYSMDDGTPLGHNIFKPEERRASFPIGAFRPQSAAYLKAQRGIITNGSLETSMSEDESKDSFGSSPLMGPISKSPLPGITGIPGVQHNPYYLGESDSFADFHPRPVGVISSQPLPTIDHQLPPGSDVDHNYKATTESREDKLSAISTKN